MSWMETSPMDQRQQFLADHRRGHVTMRELRERYAISRKTGYTWVDRMAVEGLRGLQERSRAPHSCPHKTTDRTAALLVGARHAHPDWAPKVLLDWLRPRHLRLRDWPAINTAGAILKRGRVGGHTPPATSDYASWRGRSDHGGTE